MCLEAKTAIVEHLGQQQQAMVAMLADLVNIDSGSYNKRGVDAVGERLRAFLEAAGICARRSPTRLMAIASPRACPAPAAPAGRSC
jgi:hypothetical protein